MTDDLGEITDCYTITFKRRSKHPAARLWRALTEPDEASKWLDGAVEIDLRVGGTYTLFAETEHPEECVIVRIEPERVLTFVWGLNRPNAWGNRLSVVDWVIEDGDSGCTYSFVHNGCADRGEGEEGLAAGWHGFIDQLEMHLDAVQPIETDQRRLWKLRHAPYKRRLDEALAR